MWVLVDWGKFATHAGLYSEHKLEDTILLQGSNLIPATACELDLGP